jgi:hypothetical protein
MPLHVVLRAGASRRAAIGAAVLLMGAAAINEPAFAHPGEGQGTQGPSPQSAAAPGHAQDPPGRRAHGNPSHGASSSASDARPTHVSSPASTHSVRRHSSTGEGDEGSHSTTVATSQPGTPPQNGHHKTTICHATGSATNPYVEISIPPPAVRAHSRHQDGRDIIPAPAGGCPGAAAGVTSTAQQSSGTTTAPTDAPSTVAAQTAATLVASMPVKPPADAAAPARQGVLGVTASSSPHSAAPARVGDATRPADGPAASRDGGSGLPFTGFAAMLAVALGLALVATGAGLKRASRA